ncbi:MAG: response regulator transcription factor [Eubacterium sp.]|jgi:two-component system response regulator protein BraR/BceR|nr:response regulator transcription factor [Eubacterium sp.]
MPDYKILIVEDDEAIAQTEKEHLEKWNFLVRCASDFKGIVSEVADFTPDLILLDVKLPYYNGFYWCSEIRKFSKVPIIFVSSADDDMNIVMAMDMGGDDFISKPFALSVLTAKINALLRRSYSFTGQMNLLEHKGLRLNLADAEIFYGEKSAQLSRNEFKILQLLMEHAGKMVSRDTIMMQLWESDSFIDDNTLTVNVARIRKKLNDIGAIDYIITKKGIGYLV